MEKHEQANNSRRKIFVNNFIGGLAWALGATFGLALIFVVLIPILKNINFIPYVGNFVANVIEFVITKNPNLLGR